MRQVAQLYRVVRPARKNGALTFVTVAARFVGKAIVPDFEAERPGCVAPRSRTEREVGFGQAMPAARLRPCTFEKGRQNPAIGRPERRQVLDPARTPFRLLDKDMGRGNTIVGRTFHLRSSSCGCSWRTIPDPQRVRAGKTRISQRVSPRECRDASVAGRTDGKTLKGDPGSGEAPVALHPGERACHLRLDRGQGSRSKMGTRRHPEPRV